MAKSSLSMKPTGWFQVAWSKDLEPGGVTPLKYFGKDLVLWRDTDGVPTVMDAYCPHLGAHLGHGGEVVDNNLQCPFHGWQWNKQGKNACIPYESRPMLGVKVQTYPTVEANEAIFMWHDVSGREPYFEVPKVFGSWDDGLTADDYYNAYPESAIISESAQIHPAYVLENGVDFAHFKYVHKVPIIPKFTRHDFDEPTSYVDFTITFDDSMKSFEDINSGVEAINGGLGCAITMSWGMLDHRTMTCVTPVDDTVCDVRFSVWVRKYDKETEKTARGHAQGVIQQVLNDMEVWTRMRYNESPPLVRAEHEGFTAFRAWAQQFYPENHPKAEAVDAS